MLLVWVYFVLPLIVSKLIGSRFRLDPHVAAVIGLGAAYSGFMAETLRAGLRSIHPGQAEAAAAIGMSPLKTLWRVILPQAVRRILPDIVNSRVAVQADDHRVADHGAGHHVPGFDDQRRRDAADPALTRVPRCSIAR